MRSNLLASVALCLTHDCNLRCHYCYAGRKRSMPMDLTTSRQVLRFLNTGAIDGCVVTFFGGEPLVEFNLLKQIVDDASINYPNKFIFRMATNGTLLTRETLGFLRDHGIYFSLSLDGTPQQHDCNRMFADGAGSFKAATSALNEVLASNPATVAVSVITPETIDFLAEGVKHLFGMGFRYVLQTLDYSASWTDQDIQRLEQVYRSLSGYYFDQLREGRNVFYSPFDSRIRTRSEGRYRRGDLCDLAGTQIAIAPSGRIYPCVQFVLDDDLAAQQNGIGDIWHGFDTERRSWFMEQNRHEISSCHGCALEGRCATYCGCVNWRSTGRLDAIPPLICEHERMLMPIIDRLANRLWKAKIPLFERKFYRCNMAGSSYLEDCLVEEG